MVVQMGKIEKGVKCSIIDCANLAARSISTGKAESSGLIVEGKKRTYLCRAHYKEFKKKSKGVRQINQWRWSS